MPKQPDFYSKNPLHFYAIGPLVQYLRLFDLRVPMNQVSDQKFTRLPSPILHESSCSNFFEQWQIPFQMQGFAAFHGLPNTYLYSHISISRFQPKGKYPLSALSTPIWSGMLDQFSLRRLKPSHLSDFGLYISRQAMVCIFRCPFSSLQKRSSFSNSSITIDGNFDDCIE